MSVFARTPADHVAAGLARLERDLRSGAWAERHGDLLARDEFDLGYRLLVSGEALPMVQGVRSATIS